MKKFATYLKVILTLKPDWFDDFYSKYSEPHELHITLTQPRFINERDIEKVKLEIASILEKHSFNDANKIFTFNTCVYDKESDGTHTVMLATPGNPLLVDIQKDLRGAAQKFGDYVDPVMESYETNFKPHLTIGNNIIDQEAREVKNYLSEQDSFPQGEVTELVLVVVENMNLTETRVPENLTMFSL
ncbi:MAG: 2'-5' RNA ligase family protein [Candidatus Pacebacteria bacterium]|nr:2'-5' RNA ligase family protein [Candidatus Paceibacterota bacterium]